MQDQPPHSSLYSLLRHVFSAGLSEIANQSIPLFGLILAALQIAERPPARQPITDQEVREMLRRMRQDYQQSLTSELRKRAEEIIDIAFQEVDGILNKFDLSPDELVTAAKLDYEQAARQVLKRAKDQLELLDAPVRSLTERMIKDYYSLLSHRDGRIVVPALRALLRRTEEPAPQPLAALERHRELHRQQEARDALLPAVRNFSDSLSPENLLEALQAPYRLVEFTGKAHCALRDEVAAALRGLEPHQSRAWVLWGPGGAGKTRMAVEVAPALDWQAFFVPSPTSADWTSHLPVWSRPDQPTLLIVDYAEQRPADELRVLAQAVRAAARERVAPLALLLLMRPNPREEAARHVADALAEARIQWEARMVPSVQDADDRQALFRRARARFRAALCPPNAPPEVDYAPEDLPQTPLALLALAVLAAYGHRVAHSQGDVDILDALWTQWEQPRWRRVLEAQGEKALLQTPEVWGEALERLEQALIAASLGRRFTTPEEVADWWKAHLPFRKTTARGERLDPDWLAQRLSVLFPGVEGAWRLPPISPDPLADVVLMRQLRRCPKLVSLALPVLEAEPEGAIRAALEHLGVLARLWVRAREGEERGQVEGWMRVAAEHLANWPSFARTALHRALPEPNRTLALRPFLGDYYRAWLTRALSEEERARVLRMQSVALSALGRREEALAATQEDAELYRRLAAQQPEAFLPNLAASLNNLGAMLSALGRREEALAAAQEAANIHRRLAAQQPDAFLPDLAMSLNNLGSMLFALGRQEEALAAAQEAANIHRRLAAQQPDAFLPDLAMSLNNLGIMLSDLGRREEALAAAQEAANIHRRLAAQQPDAFLPYLAMSLNNLGRALSALGRREEALAATQEAVDIRRQLAKHQPDAFLPDLAGSLGIYGVVLNSLGRHAEAAAAFADGMRAISPFVRASPAAFGELAKALLQDYLGACAAAGETPDEALVAQVRQAIE